MPQLFPAELWLLILCSVRYAMGRSSYIVDDVCVMVLRFKTFLTPRQLEQIRREVTDELARHEADGKFLGMKLDHLRWKRFVVELEEALSNASS